MKAGKKRGASVFKIGWPKSWKVLTILLFFTLCHVPDETSYDFL